MLIGFRGVDINNPDSYALDVLATILGDGRSSVFYKNIKDRLQLAFSISASNAGFRDDGIFYVSANFLPEKLNKLEIKGPRKLKGTNVIATDLRGGASLLIEYYITQSPSEAKLNPKLETIFIANKKCHTIFRIKCRSFFLR